MFHDAPAWLGHVAKYPDNLVATAQAWQEISRHWHEHGVFGSLERTRHLLWRQPAADQYVPLVKTLAWVQQRAPSGMPLVGGVLAHDNPKFMDCAAANGLLECVPVASFHTYGQASAWKN